MAWNPAMDFARGYSLMDQAMARKEEQAWLREQRKRQRKEWERQDIERIGRDIATRLGGYMVDPETGEIREDGLQRINQALRNDPALMAQFQRVYGIDGVPQLVKDPHDPTKVAATAVSADGKATPLTGSMSAGEMSANITGFLLKYNPGLLQLWMAQKERARKKAGLNAAIDAFFGDGGGSAHSTPAATPPSTPAAPSEPPAPTPSVESDDEGSSSPPDGLASASSVKVLPPYLEKPVRGAEADRILENIALWKKSGVDVNDWAVANAMFFTPEDRKRLAKILGGTPWSAAPSTTAPTESATTPAQSTTTESATTPAQPDPAAKAPDLKRAATTEAARADVPKTVKRSLRKALHTLVDAGVITGLDDIKAIVDIASKSRGGVIVKTAGENNNVVLAIDKNTGKVLWQKFVGGKGSSAGDPKRTRTELLDINRQVSLVVGDGPARPKFNAALIAVTDPKTGAFDRHAVDNPVVIRRAYQLLVDDGKRLLWRDTPLSERPMQDYAKALIAANLGFDSLSDFEDQFVDPIATFAAKAGDDPDRAVMTAARIAYLIRKKYGVSPQAATQEMLRLVRKRLNQVHDE